MTDLERKIQAAKNAISNVSLGYFPIPIDIAARVTCDDAIELHLTMHTCDVESGRPTDVHSVETLKVHLARGEEIGVYCIDQAYKLARRLVLHELDEHFSIMGKRPLNPHDVNYTKTLEEMRRLSSDAALAPTKPSVTMAGHLCGVLCWGPEGCVVPGK